MKYLIFFPLLFFLIGCEQPVITKWRDLPDDAKEYAEKGTGDVKMAELGYKVEENSLSAVENLTKALELYPNYSDGYINRGLAKHLLGDERGALSDYERAIELNPEEPQAFLNRGNSKLQLGDTNGACEDWSKAGEMGHSGAYKNIRLFCK